ncbi:16S rRNA (guanine(966)-N(2))-methyltransferase RsmD [Thermodesulfobacterium hydrogeniphilum]|uniref:16S rRNA (guanine(966)-N(2))-methyltransferase RsmD n=1 Tax=Thermodesulfobacterium hydrogeniphilum TaxID=161156 RepID=UPI00068BC640|nr:16S rRNA (guanine(966)-N(2))-methyltransferase RsmD [Thermodesulfobacterium hydrogeniphilum]
MKITGGFLKGQKLFLPPPKILEIRPLRSRIRKAIFDILGQTLSNWKVLDLFAGTGALGIEALSRGADFAVFVDYSSLSISLIKKNLEKFKLQDKAQVYKLKLPDGLIKLSKNYKNFFNLVFITPPYKKNLALKTLETFPEFLLATEPIIITEEHTDIQLPEKINNLELLQKRTYGETSLYFYSFSQ